MFEAQSDIEVRQQVATLPLVKAGMMDWSPWCRSIPTRALGRVLSVFRRQNGHGRATKAVSLCLALLSSLG